MMISISKYRERVERGSERRTGAPDTRVLFALFQRFSSLASLLVLAESEETILYTIYCANNFLQKPKRRKSKE